MCITPFLVNYATNRTSVPQNLTGHYCSNKQMWINGKTQKPIIDTCDLAELMTKTKVNVEEDDHSVHALELMTKTNLDSERDDSDTRLSHLHQLLTKTDVVQESDDTCADDLFWYQSK